MCPRQHKSQAALALDKLCRLWTYMHAHLCVLGISEALSQAAIGLITSIASLHTSHLPVCCLHLRHMTTLICSLSSSQSAAPAVVQLLQSLHGRLRA